MARRSYKEALTTLESLPDSKDVRVHKARACRGMGMLLEFESPVEALGWLQRGLDELAGADAEEEAALHIRIGNVRSGAGDHEAAEQAFKRGLALLPDGLSRMRASALGNLGLIHCLRGEVERGTELYRRALEISQRLNDLWRVAGLRHNLAIEADIAGRWTEALTGYQEALALARDLGSVEQQATLELSLGNVHIKLGDDQAAKDHLSACLALTREHNLNEYAVAVRCSLANLYLQTEQVRAARSLLAEAERLERERQAQDQLPEIYRLRALVALAEGNPQTALDDARRSVELAREAGLEPEEGVGLRVLGQALAANGQPEQAAEALAQSHTILCDLDPYEAARTRLHWGLVLADNGAAERGLPLLQEALATFRQLGARRDEQAVSEKIAVFSENVGQA